MVRSQLEQSVVSTIKGCLLSVKGGQLDLHQLKKDYFSLSGEHIPFQKLGYRTLEEFVTNTPELIVVHGGAGQAFVATRPTANTAHISRLVSGQKGSRTNRNRRVLTRPVHTALIYHKWQPTSQVSRNWRPVDQSPRIAAIAHNQLVKKAATAQAPPIGERLKLSPPIVESKPAPERRQSIETKVKSRHILPTDNNNARERVEPDEERQRNNGVGGVTYKAKFDTSGNDVSAPSVDNSAWFATKLQIREREAEPVRDIPFVRQRAPKTFVATGDAPADLQQFCALHDLQAPTVKIVRSKQKNATHYHCKIKVDAESFSSYPTEYMNEESAQKAVAASALQHLQAKYTRRRSLLLSSEKDVMDRILPMVERHFAGIWNWQVELEYEERFGEQLPANWVEIVDLLPCISITPCQGERYVLRFCHPDELFQKRLQQPLTYDVSVPSNTVQFGEDGFLVAEVACVASAREIWCRQLNTPESEAFTVMMDKMQTFYAENQVVKATNIQVGGYYVLFSEMWLRVRVFVISDDLVNCFCIDYGDEFEIPMSDLFALNPIFAKEQAQAFVCRLTGLEELYGTSDVSDALFALTGRVVQVESSTEEIDSTDPTLPVVLYDPVTKEVINKTLITSIGMESATPTLSADCPTQVYVTNATSDGCVHINIPTPGFKQLHQLMAELGAGFSAKLPATIHLVPEREKLYFFLNRDDQRWYRVQIAKKLSDDRVEVYCVDTGSVWTVTLSEQILYPLEELSEVIAHFPHQALKVRMHLPHVPADFTHVIGHMLPKDKPVVLKVIRKEADIDCVEFFKRYESDGVLFSVNASIAMEKEFKQTNGDSGVHPSMKLQRLMSLNQFDKKEVPSAGRLAAPPLSKIGTYFDVKIPCAVNPWNFFVQPLDSSRELQQLMLKLQTRYDNIPGSPLHPDDIFPGQIYASKHTDGKWYRTSCIKVIHPGSISVFYCDFGYYANLTSQQLVTLDKEFFELPYQAIKAKICGIKPVMEKWSMDDCIYFQELVLRKNFVSVIFEIEKDILYRCDIVLSLNLIDVAGENDVHINQVLVQKGIAVEV